VLAAAIAVACISGVGVAFAPHALNKSISTVGIINIVFVFMDFNFTFLN